MYQTLGVGGISTNPLPPHTTKMLKPLLFYRIQHIDWLKLLMFSFIIHPFIIQCIEASAGSSPVHVGSPVFNNNETRPSSTPPAVTPWWMLHLLRSSLLLFIRMMFIQGHVKVTKTPSVNPNDWWMGTCWRINLDKSCELFSPIVLFREIIFYPSASLEWRRPVVTSGSTTQLES